MVSGQRSDRRDGESRIQSICSVVNRGTRTVYRTPALHPNDAQWFADRGFGVVQSLVMLATECRPNQSVRDDAVTSWSWRKLRSRRGAETLPGVLALDTVAFPPPWHLSYDAFANACHATDHHTVLVAGGSDGNVHGFALTGRTASGAYLQRLAVHPDHRRAGVARLLVQRALSWAHRRGATTLYVNTEPGNEAALALYDSLGFRRLPELLHVLEREATT